MQFFDFPKITLKPALCLVLVASLSTCLGQVSREPWNSITETFLSELKLMQGDTNAFYPDTYFAPGGVICIVFKGEMVLCRPFGYSEAYNVKELVEKPAVDVDPEMGKPVRENSLFRLGSTSKMFVGLALALCKNRGLVDYNDPVSEYIESLNGTGVGEITLKQLFTHSSGLPPLHKPGLREQDDEVTRATIQEIVEGVAKLSIDPAKIGRFSYSNVGILLLAGVVSSVQEQPFEAFVRAEILEPLGMTHTYFHTSEIDTALKTTGYFPNFEAATDPDLQGYAPVGGMYSTGPDMAKFMIMLQRSLGERKDPDLQIKADIIQDFTSVYLKEHQKAMGVSVDIEYRNGNTMIGHNGRINGYASFFTFSKEAETGLIFLANGAFPLGRTSAPALLEKMLNSNGN